MIFIYILITCLWSEGWNIAHNYHVYTQLVNCFNIQARLETLP